VWHVTLICVTCHTHMCDMSHSYVWHEDMHFPIHMWDRNWVTWEAHIHSYMWHDTHSFTCVTWLIHSEEKHSRLICVTWIQAFTRSYVWLELCDMGSSHLFICVTGFSLIHEWVERKKVQKCLSALKKWVGTHSWVSGKKMWKNDWVGGKQCGRMSECSSYVWKGTHLFICMTWRPELFSDVFYFLLCFIRNTRKHCLNMNASCHDYEWVNLMFVTWCIQAEFIYIWNDSFANELSPIQQCVTSRVRKIHFTHINVSCHIYKESSFTKKNSAYIRVRHVTDIHEWSQIHQWVTACM